MHYHPTLSPAILPFLRHDTLRESNALSLQVQHHPTSSITITQIGVCHEQPLRSPHRSGSFIHTASPIQLLP